MTAEEIEAILADKYSGRGWALFFQYMPMTSFESILNKIDLVAVGLWHQHDKIIAFEIKVQRADFLKDLKNFKKKHQYARLISDEFFYVCPWGLIEKEEVPVDAGLMYVNKGNKIKIMKPARVRVIKTIPFQLFQGFAREFGNKVDHTKILVKYLGKDMNTGRYRGHGREEEGLGLWQLRRGQGQGDHRQARGEERRSLEIPEGIIADMLSHGGEGFLP